MRAIFDTITCTTVSSTECICEETKLLPQCESIYWFNKRSRFDFCCFCLFSLRGVSRPIYLLPLFCRSHRLSLLVIDQNCVISSKIASRIFLALKLLSPHYNYAVRISARYYNPRGKFPYLGKLALFLFGFFLFGFRYNSVLLKFRTHACLES